MTNPMDNPMAAIAALMRERERYEAWIATLDGRRASTAPNVYERVRTDYEVRLQEVLGQLSKRMPELDQTEVALRHRLTTLAADETSRRDARAEAELRAMVGEYPTDRWEELKQATDAEIARLASQREEVTAELARVRQILEISRGAPRAAAPPLAPMPAAPPPPPQSYAPPPAPVTAPSVAAAPIAPPPTAPPPIAPPPVAAPAPIAAQGGLPPNASDFDELAFLKSVVDARGDAATPAAPPPAPRTSAGTTAASVAAAAAAEAAPAAPEPRPSKSMLRFETPESVPAVDPHDDGSRPITRSVPAFLKDVPAEQAKTLKCQECGTMNYPTEWYCERCGGELAAM